MPAFSALTDDTTARWSWRGPVATGLAMLVVAAGAAWLAYVLAINAAVSSLQESALRRLDTVAAELTGALNRFEYLPALLETTPAVLALLAAPASPTLRDEANLTLNRINAIAGADMVFVLEPGGTALAAADWDQPATPVGHNYAYRPYMKEALATGRGRFFGIGATSKRPGYFLSYALRGGDRTLGVATVKVDLEPVVRVWANLPGELLISDERGVVILSSRAEWKFRALRPLTAAQQAEILAEKSYPADPRPLPWTAADAAIRTGQRVSIDGQEHLVTQRTMPTQRWQMQALDPLAPVHASARNGAIMAALAAAVAWLLAMAAWQSRRAAMHKLASQAALQAAYDTLEARVAERTLQLRSANASLAGEVETRKAVEQSLRDTQQELVHAAKLAVLGQISAGLAHELNQPLAALRTLSDNAVVLMDKQRLDDARGNLGRISQMVARLGELTRRLKSFAHKPGDRPVPTPLGAAVANAQGLLADRLRRQAVAFDVDIEPPELCVLADPTLIEQVLVNLMANAIDAMAGAAQRRLQVRARVVAGRAQVAVVDTGAGIAPEMAARLFEPFATSKPPGAGLGLGLMISRRIVSDFGGRLVATNNPGGGATFEIELPACPQLQAHEQPH
jgi:two-component system C4-dicarboxylate transport sensor histidine kinase DctB